MTDHRTPYSVYIHIPFCVHRCAYCDFNTYAGMQSLMPAYVVAICREIEIVAHSAPQRLTAHTIFFGGGTPSLLSARQFESILKVIQDCFTLTEEVEISLEANPGTVSMEYLRNLQSLGFNRISLGVQSIHTEELRLLGRIHDTYDVIEAVNWARQVGFTNLNLDLIFGLPEQTLERWQATVEFILGLKPDHLSLYALTVEQGTAFGRWAKQGLLPIPDPDIGADMYEQAGETLEKEGYKQYEISNWAKAGRECQHNLQYWRGLPYLGFGAGAHGFANKMRIANIIRIRSYLERLSVKNSNRDFPFPVSPATVSKTKISKWVEMQETMMTGLRLTREGVSAEEFLKRFEVDIREVFGKEIDELNTMGLLVWDGQVVHLTKRGRLLGNQAFMRFVD